MLNLLIKYAQSSGLVSEPGFNSKDVRWAIVCNANGQYQGITELGDTQQKRNPGQEFRKCPELSQPEMMRGGEGCRHFLVDNAEVVALYGDKANDPKVIAKHDYFVNLLREASKIMPELNAMAEMLITPEVLSKIQEDLKEKKARPTENITFAVLYREPMYLVDDEAWHDWWRNFRQVLSEKRQVKEKSEANTFMRCLASGEMVKPVPTHPKIKGLSDVGGLSMGTALVSFDKDSFCSYGLTQSENAAVSEEIASSYRTGLNHLIEHHSRRLAGAKVVHWYAGKVPPESDPINILEKGLSFLDDFSDTDTEEREAQNRAQQLLESLRTGKLADLADYSYYALTLSGASGRVMIRDWMEGRFEELAVNIANWFEDLKIIRRDGDGLAKPPKFMAVLGGLVRDLKDLPAPLVTKMWRVAVKNEPIPQQALSCALARVKVDVIKDEPANHARIGLIKAYHLRKKGGDQMKPYLNEEHPHPAYHCGRLMAVLADLQYSALGDVGAGVVQRYYAAASTTPALVLGRLTRTSQFHLNKLEGGLAYWYEGRIAPIWGRIKDCLPKTLTLEEQSLFALGYYQQKAAKKGNVVENSQNITKEDKDE